MNESGANVRVNSPIGTVTGGWYREKKLNIDDIRTSDGPLVDPSEEHIVMHQLGVVPTPNGPEFSETELEETILRNLTPNRFAVDVDHPDYDFQPVLDNAEIGKEYIIAGYSY